MAKKLNEVKLSKKQEEIVKKYAPKHIYGNSEDSFHNCVRECAYAFCGGKDKYDADKYTLGKMAWFKAYNTEEYRKTCVDYKEEVKPEKPAKTSRGASRNTKKSEPEKSANGMTVIYINGNKIEGTEEFCQALALKMLG